MSMISGATAIFRRATGTGTWWLVCGVLLVALMTALALLSPHFGDGIPLSDQPIIPMVALYIAAGVVFYVGAMALSRYPASRRAMVWLFAVGVVMRLAMILSTPILEVDYYRYLWDGAVASEGIDPYRYSPAEVMEDRVPGPDGDRLSRLAASSGGIVERINFPAIRTVYTPIPMLGFAAAHRMRPWSIGAWRVVLLAFDLLCALLVYRLLKSLSLSPPRMLVYWWNPLLVKEIYNSGHMDMILLPFIVLAVLSAVEKRRMGAIAACGLAGGIKIWPVCLAPVLIRRVEGDRRRAAVMVAIIAGIGVLMFAPVWLHGYDGFSPLRTYPHRWQSNDSIFRASDQLYKLILAAIGADPLISQLFTRPQTVLLALAGVALAAIRGRRDGRGMVVTCLALTAWLYLISPTQFPWYATWLIPLLCVYRSPGLLLLTVLLPLYYLRYWFLARNAVEVFDYGVVWLEFVPVWCVCAWEALSYRRLRYFRDDLPGEDPRP